LAQHLKEERAKLRKPPQSREQLPGRIVFRTGAWKKRRLPEGGPPNSDLKKRVGDKIHQPWLIQKLLL